VKSDIFISATASDIKPFNQGSDNDAQINLSSDLFPHF